MSKVFILEPPVVNTAKADEYGERVILFPEGESRPSMWDRTFGDAVVERLVEEGFDPEKDYFLLVGAQVPTVLAIVAIVDQYGPLRLLVFNARSETRDYQPLTVGDYRDETRMHHCLPGGSPSAR